MFITALFEIVQNWNQPKKSPMGKQVNKMWYILTMKEYKKYKWMNLMCMYQLWIQI